MERASYLNTFKENYKRILLGQVLEQKEIKHVTPETKQRVQLDWAII